MKVTFYWCFLFFSFPDELVLFQMSWASSKRVGWRASQYYYFIFFFLHFDELAPFQLRWQCCRQADWGADSQYSHAEVMVKLIFSLPFLEFYLLLVFRWLLFFSRPVQAELGEEPANNVNHKIFSLYFPTSWPISRWVGPAADKLI